MIDFAHVFLYAESIRKNHKSPFFGKYAQMPPNPPDLTTSKGKPLLVNIFETVYRRIMADPAGQPGRVLTRLAASLVEGIPFDLSELEALPDNDQAEGWALFDYCFTEGLTEDERQAISAAFMPILEMQTPGARH